METYQVAKIIDNLQRISANIFTTVTSSLQAGMSESDIAELIKSKYESNGIVEFWYNVPQNVLIGVERFKVGNTTSNYEIKAPSKDIFLEEGSPVFIDLSPVDPKTKIWGDWASTFIFHPRQKIDDEQSEFLNEIRNIHREGMKKINSQTTGAEVAKYYLDAFRKRRITLLDVRNNVGHSLHSGPKNKAQRIWLDESNNHPLGEGFYAVEPGGIRPKSNDKGIVIGRFEECIYIPKKGTAVILGEKEYVPTIV